MLKNINKIIKHLDKRPDKHFFENNRKKLIEAFTKNTNIQNGYLFFQGSVEQPIYDDDNEFLAYEESNFFYLFGVEDPETWGAIDIETQKATLMIAKKNPSKSFWMKLKTIEEFRETFPGDSVILIDDFPSFVELNDQNKESYAKRFYIIDGLNRETKAKLPIPHDEKFEQLINPLIVKSQELYASLITIRKNKTHEEIDLIQNSMALNNSMLKAWTECSFISKNENQLANLFVSTCLFHGLQKPSFQPKVSFEKHMLKSLHDSSFHSIAKENELFIIETGLKVNGYNSKLIRTFPVSRKFTPFQKATYDKFEKVYQNLKKNLRTITTYNQLIVNLESEVADLLLDLHVFDLKKEQLLSRGFIKSFYDEDVFHFLGLDVRDPFTFDFLTGDENGNLNNSSVFFFKFGLIFDEEQGLKLEEINKDVFKRLSVEVKALKLGDIVFVSDHQSETYKDKFPIESEKIEELLK